MFRVVNHTGIAPRRLDEALDLYVKTFRFENAEIMTREEMGDVYEALLKSKGGA